MRERVKAYWAVLTELKLLRLKPTSNQEIESKEDELDSLWWVLTSEDREELKSIPEAPLDLGMVDQTPPMMVFRQE